MIAATQAEEEPSTAPAATPTFDWAAFAQGRVHDVDSLQTLTSGLRKEVRGGSLQAHICTISRIDDVARVMEAMRAALAFQEVTSWCYGYRLRKRAVVEDGHPEEGAGDAHEGWEDGLDEGSGEKILTVMRRAGLQELLVVVSRWQDHGRDYQTPTPGLELYGLQLYSMVVERCKDLVANIKMAMGLGQVPPSPPPMPFFKERLSKKTIDFSFLPPLPEPRVPTKFGPNHFLYESSMNKQRSMPSLFGGGDVRLWMANDECLRHLPDSELWALRAIRQPDPLIERTLHAVSLLRGQSPAALSFTLWIMGFLLEAVDARAEEMGVPRSQRDWGLIGYAAFGNVGRLVFAGCMFFDLTGGALVLVSIVIEQLPFLLPFRHNVTAALSCVLAFSCCLLPKKFFSAMAVLGMSSQVLLILGLVITGVELSSLNEVATDQTALKAAGVPSAFGIALLCFLAHSEAPLIYQMMEDRKQWTKAVIYSMTLTEAFLLTFGALGYGFFGGSIAQSIADNIGRDLELQVLPGGLNVFLGAITILGLSTKQLVTLPLLLDATTDLFGERLQWKGQLLMKAIILGLSGIVVVLLKDAVAFIGDLVGILPANGVCVIFPCAALLQMYGHEMRMWQRIGVRALVVLFSLYSVFGSETERCELWGAGVRGGPPAARWGHLLQTLRSQTLRTELLLFDARCISQKTAQMALSVLEGMDAEEVRRANPGAGVLFEWAQGVARYRCLGPPESDEEDALAALQPREADLSPLPKMGRPRRLLPSPARRLPKPKSWRALERRQHCVQRACFHGFNSTHAAKMTNVPLGPGGWHYDLGHRICITGLGAKATKTRLQAAFGDYGHIIKIETPLNGTAVYISYKDKRDAEDAVKYMDGEKLDGTKITVSRADNRPPIRGKKDEAAAPKKDEKREEEKERKRPDTKPAPRERSRGRDRDRDRDRDRGRRSRRAKSKSSSRSRSRSRRRPAERDLPELSLGVWDQALGCFAPAEPQARRVAAQNRKAWDPAAGFREMPYCYASMDRKPLMPYTPNAFRSRLAVDDAPVPYKNASTIEFNDGIHTCHKRRFQTTNATVYTGEPCDPRSNQGVIAAQTRFRKFMQAK
ncbi:RNA-binding protein 1 [Symbiodinium microadriaticum]|uniref:RNA-binding protein 1 n=1 Tax=Symbiodinium microadriaticum TaxID=2951 RepID=A0A1Q9CCK0_SYMMI|nr:RNA-binding protein 1 [Symbiodinium microadriaticum]